ncbi:hypothetical protein VP01_2412g1 [Puccinia sorghi]|uniref:Uncharacterized protein n=1 Tax=Puccinia sorghi TaxID=27349 RepID=A0A0L6V6I9_9BASI|nr:hypothetical protein VP01_2412g1 [Puccinia sorghi]
MVPSRSYLNFLINFTILTSNNLIWVFSVFFSLDIIMYHNLHCNCILNILFNEFVEIQAIRQECGTSCGHKLRPGDTIQLHNVGFAHIYYPLLKIEAFCTGSLFNIYDKMRISYYLLIASEKVWESERPIHHFMKFPSLYDVCVSLQLFSFKPMKNLHFSLLEELKQMGIGFKMAQTHFFPVSLPAQPLEEPSSLFSKCFSTQFHQLKHHKCKVILGFKPKNSSTKTMMISEPCFILNLRWVMGLFLFENFIQIDITHTGDVGVTSFIKFRRFMSSSAFLAIPSFYISYLNNLFFFSQNYITKKKHYSNLCVKIIRTYRGLRIEKNLIYSEVQRYMKTTNIRKNDLNSHIKSGEIQILGEIVTEPQISWIIWMCTIKEKFIFIINRKIQNHYNCLEFPEMLQLFPQFLCLFFYLPNMTKFYNLHEFSFEHFLLSMSHLSLIDTNFNSSSPLSGNSFVIIRKVFFGSHLQIILKFETFNTSINCLKNLKFLQGSERIMTASLLYETLLRCCMPVWTQDQGLLDTVSRRLGFVCRWLGNVTRWLGNVTRWLGNVPRGPDSHILGQVFRHIPKPCLAKAELMANPTIPKNSQHLDKIILLDGHLSLNQEPYSSFDQYLTLFLFLFCFIFFRDSILKTSPNPQTPQLVLVKNSSFPILAFILLAVCFYIVFIIQGCNRLILLITLFLFLIYLFFQFWFWFYQSIKGCLQPRLSPHEFGLFLGSIVNMLRISFRVKEPCFKVYRSPHLKFLINFTFLHQIIQYPLLLIQLQKLYKSNQHSGFSHIELSCDTTSVFIRVQILIKLLLHVVLTTYNLKLIPCLSQQEESIEEDLTQPKILQSFVAKVLEFKSDRYFSFQGDSYFLGHGKIKWYKNHSHIFDISSVLKRIKFEPSRPIRLENLIQVLSLCFRNPKDTNYSLKPPLYNNRDEFRNLNNKCIFDCKPCWEDLSLYIIYPINHIMKLFLHFFLTLITFVWIFTRFDVFLYLQSIIYPKTLFITKKVLCASFNFLFLCNLTGNGHKSGCKCVSQLDWADHKPILDMTKFACNPWNLIAFSSKIKHISESISAGDLLCMYVLKYFCCYLKVKFFFKCSPRHWGLSHFTWNGLQTYPTRVFSGTVILQAQRSVTGLKCSPKLQVLGKYPVSSPWGSRPVSFFLFIYYFSHRMAHAHHPQKMNKCLGHNQISRGYGLWDSL